MTSQDHLLENFFALSLDLLCIADLDGYFRKLSDSWGILGYPIADLIGKRFLDYVHPDDIPATEHMMYRLKNNEYIEGFRNRYRCRDGVYRTIEWRSRRYDHLIFAVARDVTEIHQTEQALIESESRYRAISELTSNYAYGFAVLPNGQLNHEWTVGAFEAITGYTPQLVVERGGWSSFFHPDDMPIAQKRFADLMRGKERTDEFRIITASGDIRWIRDYAKPIWDDADNRVTFIYGAAQDITSYKQAEQQQLDLRAERDRINILADFITATSHELRTPLSVINTSLYLLMRLDNPEKRKEKAQQITEQVIYLNRVITQLHEVVRLDRLSELELDPVSLPAFVQTFIDEYHHRHQHVVIQSHIAPDIPLIQASRLHLQNLLNQLADNAVRYSPPNSTIKILVNQQEDSVILSVQDEGVGIGEDDLKKIFNPLYKVNVSRTQNENGVGVGLTIAKRIMQLHHGNISVESTLGKGTTFTVHFPIV